MMNIVYTDQKSKKGNKKITNKRRECILTVTVKKRKEKKNKIGK